MDFPGIPARLFQRIFFFGKPVDEQSFTISKSDLTLATLELRLDRENARRSDDHVIDIETVTSQIMEGAISMAP